MIKRLLPGWPAVPPRLWLTGAALAVAVLNLVLESELWAHTPGAGRWSWALLLGLLMTGGWQAGPVLWRWALAYPGPVWLGLLWRAFVLSVLAIGFVVELGLLVALVSILSNIGNG
jgi:hypothetical protein